jgi:hypothetical protein
MERRSARTTRARSFLVPLAGLAVVLAAAGCGDGGIALPSPSRTISVPSISVSLPSVSVPVPSGGSSPSVGGPGTPTPEPSVDTPTPTPTKTSRPTKTAAPTKSPTPTVTQTATETATQTATATETATETPTPSETATETPTPTPTATATAAPEPVATEDAGIPGWLWLVLAALLAGLAWFLVARARRRSAWDAEVAEAEAEVAWFGRELLPQLQRSATPEALAGGWQVSADRVAAVEDRLTALEGTAPDEVRAERARALRDAVRASRTDVEALVTTRDQAATPVQLSAASTRVLSVLNPAPPQH